MNIRNCVLATLAASIYIGATSAYADEYQSVVLVQQPLALTVAGPREDGYWVQMSQAVSPDYGILSDQAWDTMDIDDHWYQIYSEEHGRGFCLSIVESQLPGVTTVATLSPCDSYNLAQAWRDEEGDEGSRFYNAAMPEFTCLTVIADGENQNLLTMTDCGAGDLSTELWGLLNTGRPVTD